MKTIKAFLATPTGAAATAFVRVFLAAAFGAWINAGMPMSAMTGDALEGFIRVGVSAGAALVLANTVGPWEARYGIGRAKSSTGPPE